MNPTQAAIFSKQDSYPALHHQKMILENKNLFSFSGLNRFLLIGGFKWQNLRLAGS